MTGDWNNCWIKPTSGLQQSASRGKAVEIYRELKFL